MKFAHIADVHLGGWREPKLAALSFKAFGLAIAKTIDEKAKFLLISGDLFNTSLPSIDTLKHAVMGLKQLKDKKIPVYAIAGSHDYSPSGKTMLDVLEHAGLLVNVGKQEPSEGRVKLRFVEDPGTGFKLTGLHGRRGALEKGSYERLDLGQLQNQKGEKLFLFHTAITEYKPVGSMPSIALSFLPNGFRYYAGGHVHETLMAQARGEGWIVMPGPVFPNSFSELEKLDSGSMALVECSGSFQPEIVPLKLIEKICISVNLDGKSPEQASSELLSAIENTKGKLVLIRVWGKLGEGRLSELKFQEAYEKAYLQGAHFVMKNSAQAQTGELEARLIDETPSSTYDAEPDLIRTLMKVLSQEKVEGETKPAYEERIKLGFFDATKSI
jgi:DNA repair protein SbcD/Mre11